MPKHIDGWLKILVILLMLLHASTSDACSCVRSNFSERVSSAKAVIVAQVISLKYSKQESFTESVAVGYKLHSTLKGDMTGQIELATGMGIGDCGINYRVGRKYLILVGDNNLTHICLGAIMLMPPSRIENYPQTNSFLNNIEQFVKGEIKVIPSYDDPLFNLNKASMGGLNYTSSKEL